MRMAVTLGFAMSLLICQYASPKRPKKCDVFGKMWHNGRSWDRRRNATRSRHAHQHDDDTNHVAQAPNLSGKAIEA